MENPKMKLLVAAIMPLIVSCSSNACPSSIAAGIDKTHRTIKWGDSSAIEGELGHAAAVCIAVDDEPATKGGPRTRSYSIAVTATAAAQVHDTTLYRNTVRLTGQPISGTVRFEATSEQGVVLGSTTAAFNVVEHDDSSTVSARIDGLTADELQKVKRVTARWLYGG